MEQSDFLILCFALLMAFVGMVDLDTIFVGIKRKSDGNPVVGYELIKMMVFHFAYWGQYVFVIFYIRNMYGMDSTQLFGIISIVPIGLFMLFRQRILKQQS